MARGDVKKLPKETRREYAQAKAERERMARQERNQARKERRMAKQRLIDAQRQIARLAAEEIEQRVQTYGDW